MSRNQRQLPALTLACLSIALVACGSSGEEPSPDSSAAAAALPRVADPHDLSGVWWNENQAVADLQIVGEPPQLTPQGEAKFRETSALKQDVDAAVAIPTDVSNCVPVGVPRIWAQPFPMEIAQKPDLTALVYEHMHSFRVAYMDEPVPDPNEVTALQRYGNSVARWENDVLTIESTGFKDSIFLDERGLPASEGLSTVERLRKLDDMTLEVTTTIDDPEYYAEPWTVRAVLKRQNGETGAGLMEYTCGYGVYETRYAKMP